MIIKLYINSTSSSSAANILLCSLITVFSIIINHVLYQITPTKVLLSGRNTRQNAINCLSKSWCLSLHGEYWPYSITSTLTESSTYRSTANNQHCCSRHYNNKNERFHITRIWGTNRKPVPMHTKVRCELFIQHVIVTSYIMKTWHRMYNA